MINVKNADIYHYGYYRYLRNFCYNKTFVPRSIILSLMYILISILSPSCYYHSTITPEVTPSFILLAIQGCKVVTYVYELHGDQVDVSKSEFSKSS